MPPRSERSERYSEFGKLKPDQIWQTPTGARYVVADKFADHACLVRLETHPAQVSVCVDGEVQLLLHGAHLTDGALEQTRFVLIALQPRRSLAVHRTTVHRTTGVEEQTTYLLRSETGMRITRSADKDRTVAVVLMPWAGALAMHEPVEILARDVDESTMKQLVSHGPDSITGAIGQAEILKMTLTKFLQERWKP